MIEILQKNDFEQIFNIMEDSFPTDEYRPKQAQKKLFDNVIYKVYGVKENDTVIAFITVYELGEVAFAEHFAVNKNYRNKGLGKEILTYVLKKYPCPVCLEVELPETDIALRRIEFYKRNGFFLNPFDYIQPALGEGRKPVPLLIMSTQKPLTEQEFEKTKAKIYAEVYGKKG